MSQPPVESSLDDERSSPLPITDIRRRDDILKVAASGFAMGTADVVPGVSGGTMAVACGIYEQLLAAIASINGKSLGALARLQLKDFFAMVHFRFLVSLVVGLFTAVVVMVKIVGLPQLLITAPTLVYAVFFGLVLASVFILGKTVSWGLREVTCLVIGSGLGFAIVNLVPVDMPGSPLHMVFYGIVAISAMLLPGISGSFILLVLGQYERVMTAIEGLIHLDWSALLIVVPFAVGCLLGIGAFSRVVAWLLAHHHSPVVAGLCGLLVGSLWRIFPYQRTVTQEVRGKVKVVEATPYLPETWDLAVPVLVVLGFLTVFGVEYLATRRSRAPSQVAAKS